MTNDRLQLPAGEYVVTLNGVTQKVSIAPGEETSLVAGTLIVGTVEPLQGYQVEDMLGRKLVEKPVGEGIELLPGNYTLSLNGATQMVTIMAGKVSNIGIGLLLVRGGVLDSFDVYDPSGRRLLNHVMNYPVALLPGNYVVGTGGRKVQVQIVAGKRIEL
jgi:hypothetical protein